MANESESICGGLTTPVPTLTETNIFQLSPAAATNEVPPSTTPIPEDNPHASHIVMGCVSPTSSPVKQEHIPLESEIGARVYSRETMLSRVNNEIIKKATTANVFPRPTRSSARTACAAPSTFRCLVPGSLQREIGRTHNICKLADQVRGILGKVTPQKYEAVKEELLNLPIRQSTDADIEEVVATFFKKAINPEDSLILDLYVRLIVDLLEFVTRREEEEKGDKQREKESGVVVAAERSVALNFRLQLVGPLSEARSWKACRTNSEEIKPRMLRDELNASLCLLGTLYVRNFVHDAIVHFALCRLLSNKKKTQPHEIEMFCVLFKMVGPHHGPKLKESFPAFIDSIKELMRTFPDKRVCILLQNCVELHEGGWKESKNLAVPVPDARNAPNTPVQPINRGASANTNKRHFARVAYLPKQSSGNLIVVGDLHGCLAEFEAILQKTQYDPSKDRLVIIGDLVCKGYDSVGVVKRCMALRARAVLGNYDATLLGAIHRLECGNVNPRDPVVKLAAQFPTECAAWLRQLPHIIRVPQYNVILVHAGINPRYPIDQQDSWEVTHMRKVMYNGEIRAKSEAGTLWGELWHGPETIVFGHDARSGLQNLPYAKGIDSGCVGGGELTAILFPARELVSVPGWQGPGRGIDEESATPSESNYRQPSSSSEPRASPPKVLPDPPLPTDALMRLSLAPSVDQATASARSSPSVTPVTTPKGRTCLLSTPPLPV